MADDAGIPFLICKQKWNSSLKGFPRWNCHFGTLKVVCC